MMYKHKTLRDQLLQYQRQQNLTAEQRLQLSYIEQVLAHYAEIARLSKLIQTETPEVRWGTPLWYLEYVRKVLGDIELDPASEEAFNQQVQATQYYTADIDGIMQWWNAATVFCNPPYGKWTKLFMAKALEEYVLGRMGQGILLVNRSDGAWYKTMKKRFLNQGAYFCEHDQRIAFLTPDGETQNGPRYSQDTWYLGIYSETFASVFEKLGTIITPDYLKFLNR
jgi:hypothetical protein